ncbi:hypothetical protein [Amycolatopsis minnesotensis]|uniref:Uncharacterized protein n=1 Tax=Amycolatopsis minnesotensis TaxID=337894 RepID=A0ABN2QBR3_9PSEU
MAWWFRYISSGVLERLEDIAGRAAADRGPLAAEAATLAAAWTCLLRLHRQQPGKRCALCGGGTGTPTELCSAWQVAVAYLLRRMPERR